MKKLAIVNQRYGLEVNGGSEYYTRLVAEQLKDTYDVEILTTCALDYVTWENHYEEGLTHVNGVKVRRFSVKEQRDSKKFNQINERILKKNDGSLEQEWVKAQGPYCPELIQYIEEKQNEYDAFIFVTYLYYLTAVGLPKVAQKSILIPTAHDEPYIYFQLYQEIFEKPRGIIFLTDEEKAFVQKKFHNDTIPSVVAAVGVDVPEEIDGNRFRKKYGIDEDYLIYVGRIDEGKDCHWMFRYFMEYKKRNPKDKIKLVLMGKAAMEVPKHPDIHSLGFVSEEDKYDGIAASKLLILPSEFESLSISVLEAMSLGIPVLVNGKSEVLKGHCVKSNAGLYYQNYFEFELALQYMLERQDQYQCMKNNALIYVKENYKWERIIEKISRLIERVVGTCDEKQKCD